MKPPIPQIPPACWSEFKDLQEWEKYHQERTGNDRSSEALTSIADASRVTALLAITVARIVLLRPQLQCCRARYELFGCWDRTASPSVAESPRV